MYADRRVLRRIALGSVGAILLGGGISITDVRAQQDAPEDQQQVHERDDQRPREPRRTPAERGPRLTEGRLGNALAAERRTSSARVLQEELHAFIDLYLKAKQLHWNVVGPRFRPLHVQLDEIAEIAEQGSDVLAERMLALGAVPDGRAATVADRSPLKDVPQGLIQDAEVAERAAQLLESQSQRLYEHIRQLNDIDLVTQDILIDLAQQLDKQLWMLEAQDHEGREG